MASIQLKRNGVRLAALLGVGALAITGCSGGSSDRNSTDPGSGNWADLSGESLNVAADWSGTEQENFEKVLADFEKKTGATVSYTSYGSDVATTLSTKIAGGDPPDVAVIPQPGLLRELASDDNLIPLNENTQKEVEKNYSEDWLDLGSVDDTLYGVWFKGSNKSTFWYNNDLWSEAGATAPANWEEMLEQFQVVADNAGVPALSVGVDVGWPLTDWFENYYLRSAGAEKYDQLSNHEIPWTDASVVEALTALGELWGNTTLVQPGGAQRTFGDAVVQVFGDDPGAASVYEGDFVAGNIAADTNSVVGENALFFDFPAVGDSEPAVVGGGNAAVQLKDSEAASELMRYLASSDAANVWIELGGFTSPNKEADLSLYPDDTSRKIAEALVNAETFRFDMSDLAPSAFGGTQGAGEWKILSDFYRDPSNPRATAAALESSAAAAWAKN